MTPFGFPTAFIHLFVCESSVSVLNWREVSFDECPVYLTSLSLNSDTVTVKKMGLVIRLIPVRAVVSLSCYVTTKTNSSIIVMKMKCIFSNCYRDTVFM